MESDFMMFLVREKSLFESEYHPLGRRFHGRDPRKSLPAEARPLREAPDLRDQGRRIDAVLDPPRDVAPADRPPPVDEEVRGDGDAAPPGRAPAAAEQARQDAPHPARRRPAG